MREFKWVGTKAELLHRPEDISELLVSSRACELSVVALTAGP